MSRSLPRDLSRRLDNIRKLRRSRAVSVPEDPADFAVNFLSWRPFPYQMDLLTDCSPRICVCAARQVGKSTTVAVRALHASLTKTRSRVLVVAPTLRQSLLFLEKVVDLLRKSESASYLLAKTDRTSVRFLNGSRIVALPSGRFGHTIRGFTADVVIVDEAAFVPEEVITEALMPQVATTSGSIVLIGTPWDKGHVFYRCFTSSGWSVKRWPVSVCPLIPSSFVEEQRRLIGEEAFRREYLAEFVEDSNSFFSAELIRRCVADYDPSPGRGSELVAGYDWGGRSDPNALVVVECGDGLLKLVHAETWMSDSYAYSVSRLTSLQREMGFKVVLEEIGAGVLIREQLEASGVDVIGVGPSEVERTMLLLRVLMESGKVMMYLDHRLVDSLRSVKYEKTRSGKVRFFHDRGDHDDLARALALAAWGSTLSPSNASVALLEP
ncbi:MAG: terminase family protein [Thaumarchaeota archaeon]|nr:terminase family protein [Candidatus Calditenuaceae archaeon]MDW8041249.1 terminase family protein [Nitrososphaerota archaeon]